MLEKNYSLTRDQKIQSPKNYTTYTENNGQRISLKKRGKKRYFCFLQERFNDYYCFIQYSVGMPYLQDNFKKEDLAFVHNSDKELLKFLKEFFVSKSKSITFSKNSFIPNLIKEPNEK